MVCLVGDQEKHRWPDPMKPELFNELVESIREFIKIKRGELQPSRTFVIPAPETPATETPAMSPVGKRRKRPKNVA